MDGRNHRWHDHRIARRRQLLDCTLAAIREHGRDVGMDAIASANGVSKTILYKHFADKKGLADAAMARYVETALVPRINEAISEDLDEYHLTRAVISAYITTVATDPEIYIFVHANNGVGGDQDIITASEGLIAELLATVIAGRFRVLEFSTTGSTPIAFAMIGAVRLASHWWIFDQTMTADEIVDYLTMMVWGGIAGIARAEGSPATFKSQPHSFDSSSSSPEA
nr:TetR/AcrR family transcriptional regulator [Rhodococcus sp. (in: high G+C Gram-positive bacteria)]